jgi:U3 small nucleolar RNA-associated protein 5
VWDLARGEVQQRLEGETSGAAVTAVAFNAQGSLLYVGARDRHVAEWSLADGAVTRKFRAAGSDGATALAVSPSGEALAVGGSAIRIVDLSSGKKSRKLSAGLSSAVHQLRFSPCARFLVASTVGGRFLNAYDLSLADREDPAVTFSMPSSAAELFVHTASGKKGKKSKKKAGKAAVELLVGAVAHTGSLYLWAHSYSADDDQPSKPLRPSATSVVSAESDDEAAGKGASAGILLADVAGSDSADELLVVRGSVIKPVFERVSVLDNDGRELKQELAFAPVSENLLLPANKKRKVDAEADKTQQAHVPTLSARSGIANARDVVDESGVSFDDLASGDNDDEDGDNDVSLAERVEALRERVEGDLAAELARVDEDENEAGVGSGKDKPDASSLSSVLEQALQSKDNAMLEYVLRTRDAKVIGRTIQRVPSVKVLSLLEILVVKFEKSPGRCARLCPWLRAILLHHTAYLLAQPELVQQLSALYQLLENRLKAHEQLQKLAGRLSLVIGQIHEASLLSASSSGAAVVGTSADGDAPRAAVVYREGAFDGSDGWKLWSARLTNGNVLLQVRMTRKRMKATKRRRRRRMKRDRRPLTTTTTTTMMRKRRTTTWTTSKTDIATCESSAVGMYYYFTRLRS